MQIKLITVGDKLPKWVNEGFHDYVKRLPPNWPLELIEIPTQLRTKNTPAEKAMLAEGIKILKHIQPQDMVVALTPNGKPWNNQQLAAKFHDWQSYKRVVLMIGGPDGLSTDCLKRANKQWSLSNLVLPHGIARLVVIEQIYRSYSLLSNHPYHR